MDVQDQRVCVRVAQLSEKREIEALLPAYLGELGCGPEYKYLSDYWSEAGRFPYLFVQDSSVIGFALVRQLPHGSGFEMAEFYIRPEYRGKGFGRFASERVFANHRGKWRVSVLPENHGARAFWESVIAEKVSGKSMPRRDSSRRTVFEFSV